MTLSFTLLLSIRPIDVFLYLTLVELDFNFHLFRLSLGKVVRWVDCHEVGQSQVLTAILCRPYGESDFGTFALLTNGLIVVLLGCDLLLGQSLRLVGNALQEWIDCGVLTDGAILFLGVIDLWRGLYELDLSQILLIGGDVCIHLLEAQVLPCR